MSVRKGAAAHGPADDVCDSTSEKRSSGIELIFDCSGCREVPGLGNPRCFRNVLATMQQGGTPVAITLRSHIERRYGSGAAATMGRMSDVLGKIEGLQAQLARDSGKGESCQGCVGPLTATLGAVTSRLMGTDVGSAVSFAAGLEELEFGSQRTRCLDCAGITKVQVADIARNLRELERLILQGAFNISEGE